MEYIVAGLDFGTHQTKICIRITPDEGLGEPRYEFFSFHDLEGKKHYALPSIVQINENKTLSYGFVDTAREISKVSKPVMQNVEYLDEDFDIEDETEVLYDKYKTFSTNLGDKDVLRTMLKAKKEYAIKYNKAAEELAKKKYNDEISEYNQKTGYFRYFKQSSFAGRPWVAKVPCDIVSIWYLSNIIFLLEQEYGENFSINMGVPADEKTYVEKRKKAVSFLASAYELVENVFEGDYDAFLKEDVISLLEKTKIIPYSDDIKGEYFINVFPEAYASLISLTKKKKISKGLCLNADIGGGTTDISFFAVEDNSIEPKIYRYWSLPYGLNYLAEQSGYDYSDIEKIFGKRASKGVVDDYNKMKESLVLTLYKDLMKQLHKETNLNQVPLYRALSDRVIVYNGGGSTFDFISGPIQTFTNEMKIDKEAWSEENVKDKSKLIKMSHILMTSYGLSMGDDDNKVVLSPFTILFKGIISDTREERMMIDKDLC